MFYLNEFTGKHYVNVPSLLDSVQKLLLSWMRVCSQVYDSELENITEFEGLTDFCCTFKLQRGKNENGDDDPTVVGELKVIVWCLVCKLPLTFINDGKQIYADFSTIRAPLKCTLCQTTPMLLLLHVSSESSQTVDSRSVWSGCMWSGASTCSPRTTMAEYELICFTTFI